MVSTKAPAVSKMSAVTCSLPTVLNISPEKQKAVDEYVDYEFDSLRGARECWVGALGRKG